MAYCEASVHSVKCVSKIKSVLSIIIYVVYGAVLFPITHLSCGCENMTVLYHIIIIKSEVWTINHYLGLGHETMVCAVCLAMYLKHISIGDTAVLHWGKDITFVGLNSSVWKDIIEVIFQTH